MEDGNFVFMNAVYFGSRDIKDLKAKKGSAEIINQCLDFSAEVIKDIYHPKAVIYFSVPDCFTPFVNRLKIKETEKIIPKMINGEPAKHDVVKALWDDIKIIGIPHPSGVISYDDLGAIAMFLQKEL